MTVAIELREISRSYGDIRAVDGVSLAIDAGEFFAMLGPSGSGKTTCLRLIAGFEVPDSGVVLLNRIDVTHQPPYERNVNTVFQDYALFPHMTVAENVAYGLRVRGVARDEQRKRAHEMLDMVQLGQMVERKPAQLSGGQRQRVALARALINRPSVLLLDEPLSALDLKLREAMQFELKALQRRLGITFVFVTHDQGEALSMADRVAVFNNGKIEQLATPRELYHRPATAFVARFVGSANVIEAATVDASPGSANAYAIRPERVRVARAAAVAGDAFVARSGAIVDTQFHGAMTRYQIRLDNGAMIAAATSNGTHEGAFAIDERVHVSWSRADMIELRT